MTPTTDTSTRRKASGILKLLSLLLLALVSFASCSEDEGDVVEEFPDWQATNEAEWNTIYSDATSRIAAGDASWKIIKSWSIEDTLHTDNTYYIVAHVNEEGTGSGCPLYTDSVRCHYRGCLLPSTSYPSGYEFDSSWGSATSIETAAPAQMLVSSLIDGFTTALMNMHIGDDWTVYIPWPLGYGTSGSTSIPGYSVLIFDIQLVSYYRAGQEVPDFKAKPMQGEWVEE